MKLSIITINYNNANGLRKTIESVIHQTSQGFEYIVIDGGSTDGSAEIIKQYSDKLSYWVSEPDSGIYNAMNKGILKAKGQYCQFLNSGDTLVSNMTIENMLKALPDCSIFYGNMIKQLGNGKTYRDKGKEGKISMLTFYKGTLNHSPAFIKRSLFEKYGMYDEKLKIVSDWKFYFIAVGLHNELVKYVDLDVTSFDMGGISNTHNALDKQERRRVLAEYMPAGILADYDKHWQSIDQASRINKYAVPRFLFWFMERCLARFERIIE